MRVDWCLLERIIAATDCHKGPLSPNGRLCRIIALFFGNFCAISVDGVARGKNFTLIAPVGRGSQSSGVSDRPKNHDLEELECTKYSVVFGAALAVGGRRRVAQWLRSRVTPSPSVCFVTNRQILNKRFSYPKRL